MGEEVMTLPFNKEPAVPMFGPGGQKLGYLCVRKASEKAETREKALDDFVNAYNARMDASRKASEKAEAREKAHKQAAVIHNSKKSGNPKMPRLFPRDVAISAPLPTIAEEVA